MFEPSLGYFEFLYAMEISLLKTSEDLQGIISRRAESLQDIVVIIDLNCPKSRKDGVLRARRGGIVLTLEIKND